MIPRVAGLALLLSLAACSQDAPRAPEVHDTGAPPPILAPAPVGPVAGVTQQGGTVVIDGDLLFAPDSTELSPQAEPMLRRAAELVGEGEGPLIVVSGYGADPSTAQNLAKSATESLSYIGGVPFSRLEAKAVVDGSQGRRVTLSPRR